MDKVSKSGDLHVLAEVRAYLLSYHHDMRRCQFDGAAVEIRVNDAIQCRGLQLGTMFFNTSFVTRLQLTNPIHGSNLKVIRNPHEDTKEMEYRRMTVNSLLRMGLWRR